MLTPASGFEGWGVFFAARMSRAISGGESPYSRKISCLVHDSIFLAKSKKRDRHWLCSDVPRVEQATNLHCPGGPHLYLRCNVFPLCGSKEEGVQFTPFVKSQMNFPKLQGD